MNHAITLGDVLGFFGLLLVVGASFVAYAIWAVNSGRA